MLTIVICTKNAEKTIKQCLDSVKNYKIILVDKDSKDKTLKIAKEYKNVTIVNQKTDGLAAARNIGLKKVRTKYVMMLGSDNRVNEDVIKLAIQEMMINNWVGIALQTKKIGKTYISKCIEKWWNKYKSGETKVIGTPNIYITRILKQYKYDENCTHSDDTELGERISKEHKQGYSIYCARDITEDNISTIIERWSRYGKSDAEYYIKHSKYWSLKRKIESLLHPIKTEWIGLDMYYMPFYFMIVTIRYYNYIKELL
jgi:glycosyltransferase involved in cell wall biosynthesis